MTSSHQYKIQLTTSRNLFRRKLLKAHEYQFTNINTLLTHLMVKNKNYLPYKLESPKSQDTDTVVPANKKYQTLEGGNFMKIGII